MTEPTDDHVPARVQLLLTHAVASLDAEDRDARIAYCREHDEHGVRMHTADDGLLEFAWGGRRLALVRAADLAGEQPLQPEFVAEVPDTLPDDWPQR